MPHIRTAACKEPGSRHDKGTEVVCAAMAFTINTNIPSLQSQEYLRLTADFQQKTINRVTSG